MPRIPQEIPKVGLVMENARLVRWLKDVGDMVGQGEPLLELETEKSVVEIEATADGRLVEQLLEVDQAARVGDRVAWLEVEASPDAPVAGADGAAPCPAATEAAAPPASRPRSDEVRNPMPTGSSSGGRILSSPAARRLARQTGVDLGATTPTGPRGRVQLRDVMKAADSGSHPAATAKVAAHGQALSPMRRGLARAMTLSNATVPQFVVSRAVSWSSVHEVRQGFGLEGSGAQKLSVNDFLLQAIARALVAFPAMNATFQGDPGSADASIIARNGAHIGLVVAVNQGLLVPVIHDVEQLGLVEIATRRRDCVDRALRGRLKQQDLEGATFSMSNLGARGPDRFTALINPPQSAILAIGRQRDCVVPIEGKVHIQQMSELNMTVDHRVADGRLASDFLAFLVEVLEGKEWQIQ